MAESSENLRDTFQTRSKELGLHLTKPALELVTQVLSAIADDPLPEWKADGTRLTALQRQYAEMLPLLLLTHRNRSFRRMPRNHATASMTTFDVLHWVENNLSRFCFIEK